MSENNGPNKKNVTNDSSIYIYIFNFQKSYVKILVLIKRMIIIVSTWFHKSKQIP
jgi:hypothetical protein